MRVGFAGLGRMGVPMVENLVRAGFDVAVWNRTMDKADLVSASTGCSVADKPADLAAATDVVVTMLADDESSEVVHLGENGLFEASRATAFVEMGTMSPDHIATLVAAAPDGARVIDAPVSGATEAAAKALLLIMAGCEKAAAEDLMPLFDALGRKTIFLGQSGAGATMKLVVNSLIHGLNQTMAEAMALADAAGIGADAAFDVIENSAAGAPMLTYRKALYLNQDLEEVMFNIALARKDMEITKALASRLGAAMPQGTLTLDLLTQADAAGLGDRDMASMLNFVRKGTS